MRPARLLPVLARALSFPALALGCAAALAAGAATVEAVQAPAWRERGGVTAPLAVGMELHGGDVVRTGTGARAYLMLAEGSRVKLGQGARFALHSRSLSPRTSFRGALDILAGAFRFTTGTLRKAQSREVAIRVGTATIGIRGTDLWGRTDKDGDLVALIEGRIEITRAGQTVEMAQPMSYYDAPTGKAAQIKTLDLESFVGLARQTDILPGDGAARARGRWKVFAGSASSQAGALELYDAVREAGFAARIRVRGQEGEPPAFDVLLAGFADAADATAAASRLKAAGLKAEVGR